MPLGGTMWGLGKNLSNNSNSKHLLAIQLRTQNISKHLLALHIIIQTNLKAWDGGRGVCCISAAYMHVHVSVSISPESRFVWLSISASVRRMSW